MYDIIISEFPSMKNEIYIGDNLTVMSDKTFSKYIGKVKMIYIDPPYNTKNPTRRSSDLNI